MNPINLLNRTRADVPSSSTVLLGYAGIVIASSVVMLVLRWPIALLPILSIPIILIAPYYPRLIYFSMWVMWIGASLVVSYFNGSDFGLTLTAITLGGFSILLLLELVNALLAGRHRAEEALEQRSRELAALNDVTATITATLDLNQVLQRLVDTVAEMLPQVGSVTMQIVDETDGTLRTAAASSGTVPGLQDELVKFRPGEGIAGQAMAERRSINVADVTATSSYVAGAKPPNYRSLLVTPLLVGEHVWGTLSLTAKRSDAFHEGDVRLIESLARQAAIAIENAHLYQVTARRAHEQETVSGIVRALNASLDVEQAFPAVAEGLKELTGCGRVSLSRFDEQRQEFTVVALDAPVPGLDQGTVFPYGASASTPDLREGRAHLAPDLVSENDSPVRQRLVEAGFRSAVSLPLLAPHEVVGALNLASQRKAAFPRESLPLLQQIADALAASIVKSELFARVRAAEAQYRGLFENSADPIAVVDAQGIVLDVNPAACDIIGGSRDDLIGRVVNTIDNLRDEQFQRALERSLDGERSTYEFSIASRGRTRYFEARIERIDRHGKAAVQWVAHDVTARRELDHWREELTSITVHNLRNPLTWIQTGTEAARMFLPEDIDPDVVLALDKAIKGVARLEQQIDLLLNINRAEAGRELTDKEPLLPRKLINDVIELLNPRATTKKIQLVAELPDSLPIVLGNANMLAWTMQNLVDNAIKFSPDNTVVTIYARTTQQSSPRHPERSLSELNISVVDCGPGVPLADRERIFRKFYQVRRPQGHGGSGMGLYFCKLAVEAHGGQIWVENNADGSGSAFHFTLPIPQQ